LAATVACLLAAPAAATDEEPADTADSSSRSRSVADAAAFGGPGSVGVDLVEDTKETGAYLPSAWLGRVTQPYFDIKQKAEDDFGFTFGGDYTAVYQYASETWTGNEHAGGGMFRFFGSWELVGRDSDYPGMLTWKVEHRHQLGDQSSPLGIGFEIGSPLPTWPPFGDQGWVLTNFFWLQRFQRFTFLAGQVDVTDYIDIYGLVSPWGGFGNLAFLTSPTIAAPNQGLGAAVGGAIGDHIYVSAGFADANGDPTQPHDSFDTFFDDHEYFVHGEIGFTSDWDRRYLDNIHVTGWWADKREQAMVEESWGLAFSAAWFFAEHWMPFVRAGWSKGSAAAAKGSVSAGVGWYPNEGRDLVALAFNWSRPHADDFLRDQYTIEAFWRFQLFERLAITPDLQVIVNPSLRAKKDVVWVPGVRMRLTF
jgi:porin